MDTLTQAILPLLGRLLLSVIFVTSAISKSFRWDSNVEYLTSKHVPLIPVLLVAALLVESLGSLCLIVGFAARLAAAVMFLYMIPVSLLHDFMSTHFQKNLGIMGGLLMIAAFGPGSLAVSAAARALRPRKFGDVSAKRADPS
jgi:putative oxidoreductase